MSETSSCFVSMREKVIIQIDIFRNKKRDEEKYTADNQGFFLLFFLINFNVSHYKTSLKCIVQNYSFFNLFKYNR